MYKFLTSLLAAILVMTGCSKPQFTIEFELPPSLNSAYTVAYYASSPKQGKWIETAVMVQQGKGKQQLPMADPAVVALTVAGQRIYFYAERGEKIKVSGKSADPYEWEFAGNAINESWSKWRQENNSALASRDIKKINEAIAGYVKKNPENPLSSLLLLYEFNRREDNAGFLQLWGSLKGEAALEKWITISGRSDLYTNHPLSAPSPKAKHKLVLKSLDNGADTIETGRVPVVILFWRNRDEKRNELIDSLRSLRKDHPDSAEFIIADVCFDPDSVSWAAPLGRDSLRHVIRAWNPIGEADSMMRVLGVERTPFLLTLDPTGTQTKSKQTQK